MLTFILLWESFENCVSIRCLLGLLCEVSLISDSRRKQRQGGRKKTGGGGGRHIVVLLTLTSFEINVFSLNIYHFNFARLCSMRSMAP